jgi:hypothetical protein
LIFLISSKSFNLFSVIVPSGFNVKETVRFNNSSTVNLPLNENFSSLKSLDIISLALSTNS